MAHLAVYSPSWTLPAPPPSRIARAPAPAPQHLTIGRDCLLAQLERSLLTGLGANESRIELLVGPRGIGKTRVLEALARRLRAYGEELCLVSVPERLHPSSLVQLLARCLEAMPEHPELAFGTSAAAVRALQDEPGPARVTRARALIRARLGERPLLIFCEQLDELLCALGPRGRGELAELLAAEPSWSLVASARSVAKLEPLRASIHHLPELELEQCRELLALLARARGQDSLAAKLESPAGLDHVRALRHLFGGSPRAMTLLALELDHTNIAEPEHALLPMARALAPSLRERCARLSPSQRHLAELLSESWRPLTVTELAERSFTTPASVSGALRHLRREGLVQALEIGRERYYELSEPLDRLARPHPGLIDFAARLPRFYAAGLACATQSEREHQHPAPSETQLAKALDEARDHLSQSPQIAVGRLRARLASRKSPVMSAALILALERRGADEEALRVLLGAPRPQASQTHTALLCLAETPTTCAQLVALALEADAQPQRVEVRAALLGALTQHSGALHRALSELLLSYPIVSRWLEAGAHRDLGALLQCWRPPRTPPALERQLGAALESSWHAGRLLELLEPGANIDGLLALASPQLRGQLALASIVTLAKRKPPLAADELDAELRRRLGADPLDTSTSPWPTAARCAELAPNSCALLLDGLTSPSLRQAWRPSREVVEALIGAGLYGWIASRRPLAPLAAMLEALALDAELLLPRALLACKTPREALARLSAAERQLVRALLERSGDREALEHFPCLFR